MPPGSYGTSCRFSFLSPNPDPTEGRELQPDTGTGRTWGDRPSLGTEASHMRISCGLLCMLCVCHEHTHLLVL